MQGCHGSKSCPLPLRPHSSREHGHSVWRGGCAVSPHERMHVWEALLDVGLGAALPHRAKAEALRRVVQLRADPILSALCQQLPPGPQPRSWYPRRTSSPSKHALLEQLFWGCLRSEKCDSLVPIVTDVLKCPLPGHELILLGRILLPTVATLNPHKGVSATQHSGPEVPHGDWLSLCSWKLPYLEGGLHMARTHLACFPGSRS